jgi:hypothetical protein
MITAIIVDDEPYSCESLATLIERYCPDIKLLDILLFRSRCAESNAALASKSATKHKVNGLRITADRIAMMQNSNGKQSPVTINDLVNADGSAAGTEMIIKMPVIQ